MKKNISNAVKGIGALALFGLLAASASAQFNITIPKIPKIKKTQPQQQPTTATESRPSTDQSSQTSEQPAAEPKDSCSKSPAVASHLEDLETTRKQAESYVSPRDYYVQDFNDYQNIYLKAALSPSKRKEWLADWAEMAKCIEPALDVLAATAKKTLPNYTAKGYNVRNAAEEKIVRGAVSDISRATVFKVGMHSPNWQIQKDNYNFPVGRFKWGLIWAKYPDSDDGFCRMIYVKLFQDYAGGGTYGATTGSLWRVEYAGCPPGK